MSRDLGNAELRCRQLHLGGDRNFHYLLGDPNTGLAAAVDPGFDAAGFLAAAADEGLRIATILVTHGHGDHTGAAAELARRTGAPVLAGRAGVVPEAAALTDGGTVRVGELAITTLATPGHAPDHFCFLAAGHLVTGDLLFCGKVGGTGAHFPGSSARQEWNSLQRILELPDDTVVLPGHDYYGGEGVMPHSTIGHERTHNPFLVGDYAAFLDLKENWAAYKQEHGIR
jgi:glyoxylase-like metal-dependent hydrolase (beta-lactamase superfamily II)